MEVIYYFQLLFVSKFFEFIFYVVHIYHTFIWFFVTLNLPYFFSGDAKCNVDGCFTQCGDGMIVLLSRFLYFYLSTTPVFLYCLINIYVNPFLWCFNLVG